MTRRPRPAERLASAAGPLLILATVFMATQSYLFTNRFPTQHDLQVEWLPNFCFLGRSLASGHIPTWNPHAMAGLPFAGDPLHGWMNLPAMALFAAVPCATALRLYLVLQPAIGGLGLYAFLRSEEVSRTAATVGGLVLAMEIAGSAYLGVPWVSGYFAWSAALLAVLSRYLRAESRSSRLGWAIVVGLAWGQVAAAHLAFGMLVGTGAAVAYVVARILSDVRSGRRFLGESLSAVGLVVLVAILLNLAYLLPVVANLSSTTLGLGYQKVAALSLQFSRGQWDGGALARAEVLPTWPLQLALSPGLYLGAVPIMLVFAGLWNPARRRLFIAFALLGTASFVLGLSVTARNLPHALLASPVGGFYLHHTDRFRDGLLFAFPPLAALGTEAWLLRRSFRTRLLMIAPALAVWGVGTSLVGADARNHWLALVGLVIGAFLLVALALRPRLALLLPLALSVELGANALLGLSSFDSHPRGQVALLPLLPQRFEPIDLQAYVGENPIARTLSSSSGRYLSVGPEARLPSRYRTPTYWPLMTLQRSMLFGLHDAQGYNSDQLTRYWSFVRKVDPKRTWYQGSYFSDPPPIALDLLQVEWVVGPTSPAPLLSGRRPEAPEGRWTLYRLPPVPPVSVITAWRVVGSASEALDAVAASGFDPSREVVLERSPRLPAPTAGTGRAHATFRARGTQGGVIEVETSAPAVVLVRTTYHRNWRAAVDGRSVSVLPADYVDLGIPVPAGRHSITLTYNDPWVGWGLLGSAVTVAILLGAALLLRKGSR